MLPKILTAKLHVPHLHFSLISRPRLTACLNAGTHRKLTLLCAPAGFGKTTLLAEWVVHYTSSVAWLSLNQGDNVPAIFLEYLIAAMQSAHSTLGKTVSTDGDMAQFSSFQSTLIALINDITNLATPFVLILDNYHVIENAMIHKGISFLVENLPQRMHLIIATRSAPELPLARLRMRGQMIELRLDDLCFTLDETFSFLQNSVNKGLPREQVRVLYQCTEGWIDGLRMVASSLKNLAPQQYDTFITEFAKGNRDTIDYIMEEVLNRQPRDLQNFLLQTSILDSLNSSLCQAVTGDERSPEFLKQMEKSDLFVIPLDRHSETYRYHRLFAKLLTQRLRQTQPDQISELHGRASFWYEAQGRLTKAVKHALASQDRQRALYLIDTNAEIMATETQLSRFNWWLEGHSSELDFPTTHGWNESSADMDEITALLSGNPGHHDGLKTLAVGRAYLVLGQAGKAAEILPRIDLTDPEFNHDPAQITLISTLGEMHLMQGKLHWAAATYQPFLELTDEKSPTPLYARFYCGLTHLYYEWNQLDKAQSILDLCILKTRSEHKPHLHLLQIYLWQANVFFAVGDVRASNQMIQRAIRFAHRMEPSAYLERVKAHQAWLWLQQGKLRNAIQWGKTCGLKPKDSVPYSCHFEYLTFARVLTAQGHCEQALSLLTGMLEMAETAGREGDVIKILALRALAYQADGSQVHAFSDIANALCQAEHERYIRTFVNEGKPMAALLHYAAAQGVTILYVKNLLEAFATMIPGIESHTMQISYTTPATHELIEPLSARELEVLCLVAAGQTNREVAETLFIAPTTVKKHMSNILGKLGAKNRTQAAAKARHLGLL